MLVVLLRCIGEFIVIGLAEEHEMEVTLDAWRESCREAYET